MLFLYWHHRYWKSKIDCLRFVMCPLLVPSFKASFSFFAVAINRLMKQTRQAVRAFKQSILLRCLWVYPRQNPKQQSPCSNCIHRPVMSWGNACSACMHMSVRWMHRPVMSQVDACSYCMGSVILILSQIYLYSSYFDSQWAFYVY